jgi:hypothetical protein
VEVGLVDVAALGDNAGGGVTRREKVGGVVEPHQSGGAFGGDAELGLNQAPGVGDIDDLQRTLGALNAFIIGALRREVTERRTARSTGTEEPHLSGQPRPLPHTHVQNRPVPQEMLASVSGRQSWFCPF